jgi:hypothetical protein
MSALDGQITQVESVRRQIEDARGPVGILAERQASLADAHPSNIVDVAGGTVLV